MPSTLNEFLERALKDQPKINEAKMKPAFNKTIEVLMDVLEWAKGNRGSKSGNPYMIPEIKEALKHLAKLQGIKDYLDANTDKQKMNKEK